MAEAAWCVLVKLQHHMGIEKAAFIREKLFRLPFLTFRLPLIKIDFFVCLFLFQLVIVRIRIRVRVRVS